MPRREEIPQILRYAQNDVATLKMVLLQSKWRLVNNSWRATCHILHSEGEFIDINRLRIVPLNATDSKFHPEKDAASAVDPAADLGMIPAPADESCSELGVNELGGGDLGAIEHYRTDTLADSILILLILNGVQRLVGLGRAVLFCRWLSPEELGLWDMAFGFMMLAAPLSVLSIPAAYGRYIEYYRQKGQMRTLVRRTGAVSGFCAVFACSLVFAFRQWFSVLIFGSPDHVRLVELLAMVLLGVVAAHFFVALLTAMRNVRELAVIQFANSLLFAVFGAALVLAWRDAAQSVIIAYALACAVSALWSLWYVQRAWRGLPTAEQPLGHSELWAKLIPFFVWVTITDLLANLFAIVDRYMIVHYSPSGTAAALGEVGQYHSSRIIPLLMISIALLLGGIITPHLSRDWEAGNRDRAKARLRLFAKLLAFVLFAGGIAVLIGAPLLYRLAFKGKFAAGLELLPLTLTYCTWFGMTIILQNYLFCVEKARLGSIALAAGLVSNVILNLILLPAWGLMGAVVATTVANFLALALMCLMNRLLGFRLDAGSRIVLMAPVAFVLGTWTSLGLLAAIVLAAIFTDRVFSGAEREVLVETWWRYAERIKGIKSKKPRDNALPR